MQRVFDRDRAVFAAVWSTNAESTMSALSAGRQQHPSPQHLPVSVIAVDSSPPPPPSVKTSSYSPEFFGLGSPGPYSSSVDRHCNATAPSRSTRWRERPPSVDAWTEMSDGGTMKRSTSATLSNDAGDCRTHSSMPQSPHYGSTHHLGCSVTFCNAAAAVRGGGRVNASVDVNLDDEVGIRRSSSLTHATDVVFRPPETSTASTGGTQEQQQQQQQPRVKLGLTLPVITCDGVTSMPTSPLRHIRSDVTGFGSTLQLHPGTMSLGGGSRGGGSSRTILVTPQGSFLSVNQSPIEFRESTVSISYSNGAGART